MVDYKHKILLVPYKRHLSTLYTGLHASGCDLVAFVAESWMQNAHFGPVQTHIMRFFVGYPLIFYRWFTIPFQAPRYIWHFAKKVSRVEPSVMVLFDVYHWYFLQALRVKRLNPNIRLVVYSETKQWPRRLISAALLRFFLSVMRRNQKLIDAVFVYTQDGHRFLSPYIADTKLHIVPAPVEIEMHSCRRPEKDTREKGQLRILCNARFEPYKNHQDLFAAVRTLRTIGHDCRITLISRATQGKDYIEQRIRDSGLEHVVTRLDPQPKAAMAELYRTHDVLVLPSYNEAIGMVVPEAMACGVPTITSDTVGANVYVVPEKTGFIFKTGDSSALALALKKYCDAPELLHRHGMAACRHINEHFSIQKVSEDFVRLLEHV